MAMEYSKSEIREAKKRIDKLIASISDKVPYIRTDAGLNWLYYKLVGHDFEELQKELAKVKDNCVNEDDYSLAIEIKDKISPMWCGYCTRANRNDFETHKEAYPLQTLISDLSDWINEQKPSQTKPTIEAFLKAFESLAHDCIASIGFKYKTRTEKPKKPTDIVGQMETYKKTAVISELMKEIQNRIENCKTPSEMELYIISLLLPFREFCEVLRPPTPTNESRLFIKLLCTGIINQEKLNPGTIENCLRLMLNDMNDYALGLYNVLFQNSIDLNEYQQKTGVYFRKEWNPTNGMFFNIGDWDLIEHLPLVDTDEQQEEDKNINAPQVDKEKPNNARTINETELGKCFSLKFKGAGNNANYFEYLVSDLKDLNTQKDCRAVATMIWESKSGFIKQYRTFAKWCRFFFDCIDFEVPENYNYSKKDVPTDDLKRKFYYLY